MIITPENLKALQTGFRTALFLRIKEYMPLYQRFSMEIPSMRSSETYGDMSPIAGMRRWLGDRYIHNLKTKAFEVINEQFELTVSVARTDIEDDNLGLYTSRFQEIGDQAAMLPDNLFFEALLQGTTKTSYDGVPFFSTSHPVNGTTVSNYTSGSEPVWYLFDLSKVTRPFFFQNRQDTRFVSLTNPNDPDVFYKDKFVYGVDRRGAIGYSAWQLAYRSNDVLTVDTFKAARLAMMNITDDYGRPLNIVPTVLMYHPDIEEDALKILSTSSLTTVTVDGNGTTTTTEDNIWRGKAEPIMATQLIRTSFLGN
jgi:phage major head subunit gpT-like protein